MILEYDIEHDFVNWTTLPHSFFRPMTPIKSSSCAGHRCPSPRGCFRRDSGWVARRDSWRVRDPTGDLQSLSWVVSPFCWTPRLWKWAFSPGSRERIWSLHNLNKAEVNVLQLLPISSLQAWEMVYLFFDGPKLTESRRKALKGRERFQGPFRFKGASIALLQECSIC